jgi:hypothetical protein
MPEYSTRDAVEEEGGGAKRCSMVKPFLCLFLRLQSYVMNVHTVLLAIMASLRMDTQVKDTVCDGGANESMVSKLVSCCGPLRPMQR